MRFLVLLLLCGCVSVAPFGRDFDLSKATAIERGKTTDADLRQIFGEPFQQQFTANGGKKMTWIYSRAEMGGVKDYRGP
jgi:hypothetical protein